MNFRPFGTKIDLYSPLPPDECRRRLEAKFVPGWERPNVRRPRGRFFGRLLIMWLGAFDWINRESEPKLIMWLKPQASGTRISGRAIPGIQFVLYLIPAAIGAIWGSLALLAYQPNHPPADPITYVVVKIIVALVPVGFVASIWWFADAESKYGRPLRTFLERTLLVDDETSNGSA
jgi:hypothetical protein